MTDQTPEDHLEQALDHLQNAREKLDDDDEDEDDLLEQDIIDAWNDIADIIAYHYETNHQI